MKTCETCRFWIRPAWFTSPSLDWLYCGMAQNSVGRPTPRKSLAIAVDGEERFAELTTHRTFGCIQHQSK
jgi:hypothetical protein